MLNADYWRVMFVIPIIICVAQSLLLRLFFNYETPMFSILQRKDPAEAAKVLNRIYQTEDEHKVW